MEKVERDQSLTLMVPCMRSVSGVQSSKENFNNVIIRVNTKRIRNMEKGSTPILMVTSILECTRFDFINPKSSLNFYVIRMIWRMAMEHLFGLMDTDILEHLSMV